MGNAPRRAARKDTIQANVVSGLRRIGGLVHIHDDAPWDLTVMYGSPGKPRRHLLLELKSGAAGKLTPAQRRAINEGWPIHVCRSVEEALSIVTGQSGAALDIVDEAPRRTIKHMGVE
jgi:hypothetical protein